MCNTGSSYNKEYDKCDDNWFETREITKSLNKFRDTESLRVVKKEFLKSNEVRIRHNGIRYEVEQSWKEKYRDISYNYILAKRPLYSQITRL